MKRSFYLLNCLLFGFLAFPLYATIKIGTVFFYPPFVTSPQTGFDLDLAKTLCAQMHESCQFYPMNFNALFTALKQGKIDMAVGGISIYPDNESYIFSLPYLLSKAQLLVLQKSKLQSLEDLKGKVLGIIHGEGTEGFLYKYVLTHFPEEKQIILYDNLEDMITALGNGVIDAAFMHRATAIYWAQNSDNKFRPFGKTMFFGQGIGFISTPAHQDLINNINQAMIDIENNNVYLNIYSTYFSNE